MTSRSDQQQQPQPPPPAPTVAGVYEHIDQEGAAQLVALTWNQIQHGAEWVGNTAFDTYKMLSNAYVHMVHGPTKPIENKDTTNVEFRNNVHPPILKRPITTKIIVSQNSVVVWVSKKLFI